MISAFPAERIFVAETSAETVKPSASPPRTLRVFPFSAKPVSWFAKRPLKTGVCHSFIVRSSPFEALRPAAEEEEKSGFTEKVDVFPTSKEKPGAEKALFRPGAERTADLRWRPVTVNPPAMPARRAGALFPR